MYLWDRGLGLGLWVCTTSRHVLSWLVEAGGAGVLFFDGVCGGHWSLSKVNQSTVPGYFLVLPVSIPGPYQYLRSEK